MLIAGPELPYKVYRIGNAMFTSPNGGGVIIAGGQTGEFPWNNKAISDIIELRAGARNWTILEQKLNQPRDDHVIIPLP